jgi:hypothetical protein
LTNLERFTGIIGYLFIITESMKRNIGAFEVQIDKKFPRKELSMEDEIECDENIKMFVERLNTSKSDKLYSCKNLINSENCVVNYYENIFSPEDTNIYFNYLSDRAKVTWNPEIVNIYGKIYTMKRKTTYWGN